MKIVNSKLKGLKIIISKKFIDNRGYLREIYKKKIIKENLVFHYFAKSKKNVFRGFHFQRRNQQTKLVTVLEGKIIDICIDLRRNSLPNNFQRLKFIAPKSVSLRGTFVKDEVCDTKGQLGIGVTALVSLRKLL